MKILGCGKLANSSSVKFNLAIAAAHSLAIGASTAPASFAFGTKLGAVAGPPLL